MAHTWTLEVGGVSVSYKSIDFDRNFNSPNPTELEAVIDYQSITYFHTLVAKNNGTIEWYGYVEDAKPMWTEEGLKLLIWGRDRTLVLWKKFTERFSDTRLEGFFGVTDPAKVLKFLLQCPVSDDPTTSAFCKIGWGIDSSDWTCSAKRTAVGRHPSWVGTRTEGLAWKNGILEFEDTDLVVNGWSNDTSEWTKNGSSPYLDDDDSTNYIAATTLTDEDRYYTLADLSSTLYPRGTITAANLYVKGKFVDDGGSSGTDVVTVRAYVYFADVSQGYIDLTWDGTETSWTLKSGDVSSLIETIAEANNAQIRLEWSGATNPANHHPEVTYMYLRVSGYTTDYQTENDYIKVDLGESHNRVCGIIVECRHTSTYYARNYAIETSPDDSVWTSRASKTSNTIRDIVEAWNPVDSVRYVRIRLTADSENYWEVSQIYIYEADTKKYCVQDVGSGTTPTPHIESVTLGDYVTAESTMTPLNLPFDRLSKNIQRIVDACKDTNYDTWEWWVDHNDGEFHFASRKGSDLSSSIFFVTGSELGGVGLEKSCRGATTRVRVLGKSEGKKQDEVTSDWKVNTTGETAIASFYENVITDKSVSDKDTADIMANVEARAHGNVEETFEIKVNNDEESPMAYDVGDDVTVTDSTTGLAGAYRIHSLHKRIDEDGEDITLYVGNKWEDVSDEMAEIKRLIRSALGTGSAIDDWLGEAHNQDKLDGTQITDVWELTASNGEQKTPSSKTDASWDWSTLGDGENYSQAYDVTENWFYLKGSKEAGVSHSLTGFVTEPHIDFDHNPKFVVEIYIKNDGDVSTGGTDWNTDDYLDIRMGYGTGNSQMGFRIKRSSTYDLYFYLGDSSPPAQEVKYGTITAVTKHELKCICDWESRLVKYYLNGTLIGVLRFSSGESGSSNDLHPLYISLFTTSDDPVAHWAWVYLYRFQSKWDRMTQ